MCGLARHVLICCVDEFLARSPDELSLRRGDRIELVERDDDFGDGWFLGKNTETGDSGLFPEGACCCRFPISAQEQVALACSELLSSC